MGRSKAQKQRHREAALIREASTVEQAITRYDEIVSANRRRQQAKRDDRSVFKHLGFEKPTLDLAKHRKQSDSALDRADARLKAVEYSMGLETAKAYTNVSRALVQTGTDANGQPTYEMRESRATTYSRQRGTHLERSNPIRATGVDVVGVESVTAFDLFRTPKSSRRVNRVLNGTLPLLQSEIDAKNAAKQARAVTVQASREAKAKAKAIRDQKRLYNRSRKNSPVTVSQVDN